MPDHHPPSTVQASPGTPSAPQRRPALPTPDLLPHTTAALHRLCAVLGLRGAELHVVVLGQALRVQVADGSGPGAVLRRTLAAGALHSGGRLVAVAAAEGTQELEMGLDVLAGLLPELLDADAEVARSARRLSASAELARTDPLTGLGNRRAWQAEVPAQAARARRAGLALAVVVIDLDGLKAANDTHGHRHGDDLLRRAAAVLTEQARAGDTICRLGGDEFAVAGLVRADDDGSGVAERLRAALHAHHVPASVGAAAARPVDGDTDALLSQLWQRADGRMYQDKAR